MPLTPATTDKFQKVGLPGSATNLSSPGYTVGNNALTVGATTNHPTDTLYTFAVDRAQTVNGVTSRIPGTYCEFEGIVTGATTIGSVVLKYGTAQNYPAGSFTRVYIPVSSNRENALIDGLNQDHNGKGNHKNLTDDNGNIWLERNQTTSAVNQVRVTNSSTGNGVAVEANGSDTNTNIHIRGKGTGVAVLKNPELFGNFVASGGVVAISSGLIGTFSDMFFYVGGDRFKKTSVANKTYTINKDTYVDADPTNNGTLTYTEVANGATSPALATNYVRAAKVVTNGTAIASIAQNGYDSINNSIAPPAPNEGSNRKTWSAAANIPSNAALSNVYQDYATVALPATTKAHKYLIAANFTFNGNGMGNANDITMAIRVANNALAGQIHSTSNGVANYFRPLSASAVFVASAAGGDVVQFSAVCNVAGTGISNNGNSHYTIIDLGLA